MKIKILKELTINTKTIFLYKVGKIYFLDNIYLDGRKKLRLQKFKESISQYSLGGNLICNARLVMEDIPMSSPTTSYVRIIAKDELELMEWFSTIGGQ